MKEYRPAGGTGARPYALEAAPETDPRAPLGSTTEREP
jgi:hypothetical protein